MFSLDNYSRSKSTKSESSRWRRLAGVSSSLAEVSAGRDPAAVVVVEPEVDGAVDREVAAVWLGRLETAERDE